MIPTLSKCNPRIRLARNQVVKFKYERYEPRHCGSIDSKIQNQLRASLIRQEVIVNSIPDKIDNEPDFSPAGTGLACIIILFQTLFLVLLAPLANGKWPVNRGSAALKNHESTYTRQAIRKVQHPAQ